MKSKTCVAIIALLACLLFPPSASAKPTETFAPLAAPDTYPAGISDLRETPSYAEPAKSRRGKAEGNEHKRIGNALDRRTAKSVTTSSSTENFNYFYHGEMIWKEVRETDGQPAATVWYLNGEAIDSWQARQVRTPGQLGYSTLQWFLSDRMGSVQAVTDQTGTPLETYTYSAFGVRSVFDPSGLSLQVSSLHNPIGFTGREHDEETGLTYYRARYMDPVLGRFISEDPIGFEAGDYNLARYVWNRPSGYMDPFGLVTVAGYGQTHKNSAAGAQGASNVASVFYTGGPKARAAAEAAAAANGYNILNVPSGLINILSVTLRASQASVIEQMSAAYASVAVRAIVYVGPAGISNLSVWVRIEEKVLRALRVPIEYVFVGG